MRSTVSSAATLSRGGAVAPRCVARRAASRPIAAAASSSSTPSSTTPATTTSAPAVAAASLKKQQQRGARTPAATSGDGATVKTTRAATTRKPPKSKVVAAAASSDVATTLQAPTPAPDGALEIDSVLAAELADNGFRSTRRTKIICTIGPASCSPEVLGELAAGGMNVARLNMCHGSHEWHTSVIDSIRRLNKEKGYCVAIMVDTEGSEVHTGELQKPLKAETGAEFTFTVRDVSKGNESGENEKNRVIGVSYDGFVDDVEPGDAIVVDGGMVSLEVVSKAGPDVLAVVVEPGLVLSRANLTFRRGGSVLRARNSMLPVLSSKDWLDIDFALAQEVDFIAVSFVKSADVINNLKSYLAARGGKSGRAIEVIAKVESFDSVPNLAEIVEASDAVMVARGDLGAQIPMEDVPSVQKEVVTRCRQAGKPVIVASHLLQSMIEYPTPTRAEVADVSDVVRQRADALMLSGESAVGAYAVKAVEVLRAVATHSEEWVRRERHGALVLPRLTDAPDGRASEELCAAAAQLAGNLGARAIFVYTRRGYMANFLSRCRPDCPVFAFTDSQDVRRRLNLRWGVMPFRLDFSADPEENVTRTFALLKRRDMVARGDLVVVVSDIRTLDQASEAARASGRPDDGTGVVRSVQVRRVP